MKDEKDDSRIPTGYVNLKSKDLAGTEKMTVQFPENVNGSLIINVDCSDVPSGEVVKVLNNMEFYVGSKKIDPTEIIEFTYGRLIWNFTNAKGKEIEMGIGLGMVLAPDSTAKMKFNFNGTICADKIIAEGETHRMDFTGSVFDERALHIVKNDELETAKQLPGAEFQIKIKIDGLWKPVWAMKSTEEGPADAYTYLSYDNAPDNIDVHQVTDTFVTGSKGDFQIYGLPKNFDFQIIETKAPSGYEITDRIIEFTTSGTSDKNLSFLNSIGTLYIHNKATNDYSLPETGGSGTRSVTYAGVALIVGSGFLIVKRRKELTK